ncbi:InlB B-repeat-containing protein, partial [Candidatus Saccharibacteria bacterium]|nr:InlB B-repeat-containing protein [Candidatus Saccharibacteria bacterium]
TISISTNSETSNDLTRNGIDSATKTIPATTGSSLLDNTWGFSTDGGTTYNPVPMKGGTATYVYDAVEAATNKNIPVQFGIKTDSSLPSGTYTTDVVYTASVKSGCLTYAITWNMNSGTAKSGVTYPATSHWGDKIDLSQLTPTRNGYTFAGWSNGSQVIDGSETEADINPENNLSTTMTAQWTPTPYTISYNLNGGSASNRTSYDIETATFTLTNPTRSGYVFTGWSGTGLSGSTNRSVSVAKGSTGARSYTANWHLAMQGYSCSSLASGGSVTLMDARDYNTYLIKKLADGKCWMTQSLRIAGRTISSADSNMSSGSWTVPASSLSGFTAANTNYAYVNSNGGFYSFYTATVGWGTSSRTSGSSPNDICPKGWRLPTGGSSGEFKALYNKYNSSTALRGTPAMVYSGATANNALSFNGTDGFYWSSTAHSTSNIAYSLRFNNTGVLPDDWAYKYAGLAIRCVAK